MLTFYPSLYIAGQNNFVSAQKCRKKYSFKQENRVSAYFKVVGKQLILADLSKTVVAS